MAGVLSFALEMETGKATADMARAVMGYQGMEVSIRKLNEAISQMNVSSAKSSEFFISPVMMNKELAASIGRVTSQYGANTRAINNMSSATKSAASGLRAAESVFAAFGGSIAPQLTAAINGVAMAYHNVRNAAAGANSVMASRAIGAVGLAAGAAGVITVISNYFDRKRSDEEIEAQVNELKDKKDKLKTRLQNLSRDGKITDKQSIDFQVRLSLAQGTVDSLTSAITETISGIDKMLAARGERLNALTDVGHFEQEIKARSLSGKDRALAELDIEMGGVMDKFATLANSAGQDPDQYEKVWNMYASQRRKEIDEQFAVNETKGFKENGGRTLPPIQLTSLERIGLVMNGSRENSGGSSDYVRQTAGFAKRQNELTQQLINKVGEKSYANQ